VSGLIPQLSFLQSPVFLLNSRHRHFSAAHFRGHPFSRSYGVNLPSSLATDHSSALVYSTCLPVSVCGTGNTHLKLRRFSRKSTWMLIPLSDDSGYFHRSDPRRICLPRVALHGLNAHFRPCAAFTFFRLSIAVVLVLEY
jgi:hypothetical protein